MTLEKVDLTGLRLRRAILLLGPAMTALCVGGMRPCLADGLTPQQLQVLLAAGNGSSSFQAQNNALTPAQQSALAGAAQLGTASMPGSDLSNNEITVSGSSTTLQTFLQGLSTTFLGIGADSSNQIVKSLGDTMGRTLASVAGDVYNIAQHGAAGDAASDNAAMNKAIAYATANPGTHIKIPMGTWAFTSAATFGFKLPSSTYLEGDGNASVITWNDSNTNGYYLFGSTGTSVARATNIQVRSLKIQGGFALNGDFNHTGTSGPLFLVYTDGVDYAHITIANSRAFGLGCNYCSNVTVENNTVLYAASDAIPIWASSNVNITHNHIAHTVDDAISTHSATDDPDVVRRNISITDNDIFDSSSISAGAARNLLIADNNLDTVKSHAITLFTSLAGTASQGDTYMDNVVVSGNRMSNVLDRTQGLDNYQSGDAFVIITPESSRAGGGSAVPGESVAGVATIQDPIPTFLANSQSSSVAIGVSQNILITGNIMSRTLPQTDGSTSPAFANWVALQQGTIIGADKFYNPSLGNANLQSFGIWIDPGSIRGVTIAANHFSGIYTGVLVLGSSGSDTSDLLINDNSFINMPLGYGINFASAGTVQAHVSNNLFDLDPYNLSSNRAGGGKWATAGLATAIYQSNGSKGVVATHNHFLNVSQDTNVDTTNPASGWVWRDNMAFGNIGVPGVFSATLNTGVGKASPGTLIVPTDSTPGDANYGQFLSVPVQAAPAAPTTGQWTVGQFVENTAPSASIPYRGWLRLTTGTSNVPGTDWAGVPVLIGGTLQVPSGVVAGPNALASTGQIASVSASGGTYYNSLTGTLPIAFTVPSPTSGTQATGHVTGFVAYTANAPSAAGSGYTAGTAYPITDSTGKITIGTLTPSASGGLASSGNTFSYTPVSGSALPQGPFNIGPASMGGQISYFNFHVTSIAIDTAGSGYLGNQALVFSTTNNSGTSASGTAYVGGSATLGGKTYLDVAGTMWVQETSSGKVTIGTGSTNLFSVDSSGNVVAKGTITGSASP